jgi:hypothetical protein
VVYPRDRVYTAAFKNLDVCAFQRAYKDCVVVICQPCFGCLSQSGQKQCYFLTLIFVAANFSKRTLLYIHAIASTRPPLKNLDVCAFQRAYKDCVVVICRPCFGRTTSSESEWTKAMLLNTYLCRSQLKQTQRTLLSIHTIASTRPLLKI